MPLRFAEFFCNGVFSTTPGPGIGVDGFTLVNTSPIAQNYSDHTIVVSDTTVASINDPAGYRVMTDSTPPPAGAPNDPKFVPSLGPFAAYEVRRFTDFECGIGTGTTGKVGNLRWSFPTAARFHWGLIIDGSGTVVDSFFGNILAAQILPINITVGGTTITSVPWTGPGIDLSGSSETTYSRNLSGSFEQDAAGWDSGEAVVKYPFFRGDCIICVGLSSILSIKLPDDVSISPSHRIRTEWCLMDGSPSPLLLTPDHLVRVDGEIMPAERATNKMIKRQDHMVDLVSPNPRFINLKGWHVKVNGSDPAS